MMRFTGKNPTPFASRRHSFKRCISLSTARTDSGTPCNAGADSVNPELAKVLKSLYKTSHFKVDGQLPHAAANPNNKFTFPICGRMTNEQ